jgi:hypothetical protein
MSAAWNLGEALQYCYCALKVPLRARDGQRFLRRNAGKRSMNSKGVQLLWKQSNLLVDIIRIMS